MTCQDDANFVGPIALFLGVETAHWAVNDFADAGLFCIQHNIRTIFLKCFEVGSSAGDSQGMWYGGSSGIDNIINTFQKTFNIMVIPYGFVYGDAPDITTEIATSVYLLQKYGRLCLDMEGSYWSGPDKAIPAKKFADALLPIPGKLFISCPADPTPNGQAPFIHAISPAVNVWMPMIYSNNLASLYGADFNVQIDCIQPTLDLSQEFGANNVQGIAQQLKDAGVLALSLWEYQFATNTPDTVDALATIMKGGNMSIITNHGAVIDLVKSFQLENADNETQDACGPWSVSELKYAGLPGQGPTGTAEQVDQWADAEYTKYIGPNTISDQQGSSIDNMHSFLRDAGLHWWDTNTDIKSIHAALDAGYPVLVTVDELSVKRRDGSNPYPWQPAMGHANHIFTVVGHTSDGFLLCDDELNQNDNWPVQYNESSLTISWASIVQVVGPDVNNPWLDKIPNGDPLTWPVGFNAQLFAQHIVQQEDTLEQAIWDATAPLFGGTPANFNTGIAAQWKADFVAGHRHGPPITTEFQATVIGSTNPGKVPTQLFLNGFYQYNNGKATWSPFL